MDNEQPILLFNSYTGSDKSFQQLLAWGIPEGFTGRIFNLTLRSSNDAKTLWKVVLAGHDQKLPRDKPLVTPAELHYYGTRVAGPDAIVIEVTSVDGSPITASAILTAALENAAP